MLWLFRRLCRGFLRLVRGAPVEEREAISEWVVIVERGKDGKVVSIL